MVNLKQLAEGSEILRKMFIGGLSQITTENTLLNFYQRFGELEDVVLMRDSATNRSRGFAFVTYKDTASVDRAQAARPHVIDGKTVDSKRALLRTDTPKAATGNSGRKIFVGGLKDNHDELSLREHFLQFGDVLGVKILVDKNTGRKRGFAYVEFEDYDSADKAVLQKNHVIQYLSVEVKKSNYKEERAKRLAGQDGALQNGEQHVQAPGVPAHSAYPPQGYPPAYGYPPAHGYNGWGAPPPQYDQQSAVATYATQPQAHTAAYVQQPAATYPTQPPPTQYAPQQQAAYAVPPTWNGWSYSAPPGTPTQAPAAAPPATNGWNNSTPQTNGWPNSPPPTNGWTNSTPPTTQNFGTYEQSYNGGPQKTGKLQSNRNNPYRT